MTSIRFDWISALEDLHAPSVGGFQTAELYLFLVTQNEMVKALSFADVALALDLGQCHLFCHKDI